MELITAVKGPCGLYNKHITIVNDTSRVVKIMMIGDATIIVDDTAKATSNKNIYSTCFTFIFLWYRPLAWGFLDK